MKTHKLKFTATAEQGKVSAILLRPDGAKALVLLAHGAGIDMHHHGMEKLATGLADEGVASFRYNFPYKEKGRGGPNTAKVLTATVRSAVDAAAKAAPDLPLFAGGRSMGGRMTSLAASEQLLPGVRGLVFSVFPLHAAGKPGNERADHLTAIDLPMLFLTGTRDPLAKLAYLQPVVKKLGRHARLHVVEGADHSYRVLKSSERTEEGVYKEVTGAMAEWVDGVL